MSTVRWVDAAEEHGYDRCPARISAGDPMAWLPAHDELACFDCGSVADGPVPSRGRETA